MLRRRLTLICTGIYRWVFAKSKTSCSSSVKPDTAPATELDVDKIVNIKNDIRLKSVDANEPYIDEKFVFVRKSGMAQADSSEMKTNVTVKTKTFANLFGYWRAPIEYVETIILTVRACVANATAVLISTVDRTSSKSVATLDSANTMGIESSDKTRSSTQMNMSISDTTELNADSVSSSGASATLSWWMYPELDENGVLYIRQVYEITRNGETLEVK